MKIIMIYEENHGLICVAKTAYDAIDFLITNYWIDEEYEIWDKCNEQWVSIIDYFGIDWKYVVYEMSIKKFNEVFDPDITLHIQNIYESKP